MVYSLPETGFVRLPTVLATIQVGKSTWWAGVRDGRFPKPVKLTPRCTLWRAEDLRALINSVPWEPWLEPNSSRAATIAELTR